MANFSERIKNYFTELLLPSAAFQLSSRYLSGIHVSAKERRVKQHFIFPLKGEVIEPSFDKKNIKDSSYLEEKIGEGARKLHLSRSEVSCLIPELCLKVFVLTFDSLPSSPKEKEKIVRWRLKKQMPLLPDDARFSFYVIRSNERTKVLVCVARATVIQEYEDLFERLRLKVKLVGVATLSLFNLINWEEEKEAIVANIEEDSVGLMAVINSEVTLYRIKPFTLDSQHQIPASKKIENIIQEMENTIHFVEDREKKKVNSLWLRLGFLETEGDLFSQLKKKFALPLKQIEPEGELELHSRGKQILSPLIGQIL